MAWKFWQRPPDRDRPADQSGRPPIQIRRVSESRPAGPRLPITPTSPPMPEQPESAPPPSGPTADGPTTLGRFGSPARALSCWIALRNALADTGQWISPIVRQGPDRALWVYAPLSSGTGAGIVWANGGDAYRVTDDRIQVQAGTRPQVGPPTPERFESWPVVAPVELLLNCSLWTAPLGRPTHLTVLVLGQLTHHVVRRGLDAGVDVSYRAVRAIAMFAEQEERAAVLVRITAAQPVPATLLRALTTLPHTIVCAPVTNAETLLVAVGHRLPLSDADAADLAAEVDEKERWIFGAPGTGTWRLHEQGVNWISANQLLNAPGLATVPDLPNVGARLVPRSIAVQLVPCAADNGTPDAVLVEESELDTLRRYLTGRDLGETGFLVAGPGAFLILQSGGLVRHLPIGQPLRQIGPGGVFIVNGYELYPPVPASGRAELFSLTPGDAVVVGDGLIRRFHLTNMLPMWSLWLSEAPMVVDEVSPTAREMLDRLDAELGARPTPTERDAGPTGQRRSELHRQAVKAETDGDAEQAASLLQQAGDFAAAGRVLEHAARLREAK